MKYVIAGGSDNWISTNAKTLKGAKMLASKIYQPSANGMLQVAVCEGERYEQVAVKHGYGKWQTA